MRQRGHEELKEQEEGMVQSPADAANISVLLCSSRRVISDDWFTLSLTVKNKDNDSFLFFNVKKFVTFWASVPKSQADMVLHGCSFPPNLSKERAWGDAAIHRATVVCYSWLPTTFHWARIRLMLHISEAWLVFFPCLSLPYGFRSRLNSSYLVHHRWPYWVKKSRYFACPL